MSRKFSLFMSRKFCLLLVSTLATIALLSCQPAQTPTNTAENKTTPAPAETAKAAPTDLEALSNRLVVQVAGIKEGEIVFISGGVRDLELLENLNTDVRKAGAFPLLTIGSDRMFKKYYEEVPEKYDSQAPELELKLATLPAAAIIIDTNESDDISAGIPPARQAAVGKAGEPVADIYLKRNVRQVSIGNGIYPTAYRATRFGMSQDDLAKTFWESVNADYTAIQATGEKVKTELSTGKEVHITNPNGTDLKVKIEGRPFFVSDGIISADDVKKGGPAVSVYIPAGEVFCATVPGTAEGKVVETLTHFRGKEVNNLTLTFARGKLTEMTGSGPGFADLKAAYDASGAGKELFAFVDFGINPNLRIWPTSKLGNWVQSGMVTVGIGNNAWAGGDNKVSYGLTNYLPGSTVTMDGKPVVENGVLKL
ncbi:MAG: aminopeptidase [Acidobacteriota bacterium]|nr:aminopeptidase [Acidobacteriota bacterium]